MAMTACLFVPVHPRAGGEHEEHDLEVYSECGSSPRRRGTRGGDERGCGSRRFIPAQAGNTPRARRLSRRCTVHPRAGGEHTHGMATARPTSGSSPRRRGTRPDAPIGQSVQRFIPAQAGNTRRCPGSAAQPTVHPRAGGEHVAVLDGDAVGSGSSPRRRGTPLHFGLELRGERFIPAQAGNTSRLLDGRDAGDGSSPRRRGTRLRRAHRYHSNRFIPAQAGNTSRCLVSCRRRSVHPRAGGEHGGAGDVVDALGGSSPRRRGTPRLRTRPYSRARFIPAQAGNTFCESGSRS